MQKCNIKWKPCRYFSFRLFNSIWNLNIYCHNEPYTHSAGAQKVNWTMLGKWSHHESLKIRINTLFHTSAYKFVDIMNICFICCTENKGGRGSEHTCTLKIHRIEHINKLFCDNVAAAFGTSLIPRSCSLGKQIHVLCLLCYQYDVMIKTRHCRAHNTWGDRSLELSARP